MYGKIYSKYFIASFFVLILILLLFTVSTHSFAYADINSSLPAVNGMNNSELAANVYGIDRYPAADIYGYENNKEI